MTRCDVIVVGGGVAGLATAGRLAAADRSVALLEARPRLGGRVHTLTDPDSGHPIELGAEFIQGDSADVFEIVRSAGLPLQELSERHEYQRAGDERPSLDPFALVHRLLKARRSGLRDLPVSQLLREHQGTRFSPQELAAIRAYLEGFHAADLDRFGVEALAENQAAEEADGNGIYRLGKGLGSLVDQLIRRLDPDRVQLRTESVVTHVRWRKSDVVVEAQTPAGSTEIHAAQLVLAVPLTILKLGKAETGAIRLEPNPPGWDAALAALHMGAARRIVLQFDDAWWLSQDRPPTVFIHGRDQPLPVWWTASPPEAPFLTGWAGGPRAEALAGRNHEEIVGLGVQSVSSIFGHPEGKLKRWLRAGYTHDWSRDPFSRGGYSYGGVGAKEAVDVLRQPVAGTLFLTGEAIAGQGRNATVPGALASGWQTARAVLRS